MFNDMKILETNVFPIFDTLEIISIFELDLSKMINLQFITHKTQIFQILIFDRELKRNLSEYILLKQLNCSIGEK